MIAAGWSDPAIGIRVRELLQGWLDLVTSVVREAERDLGPTRSIYRRRSSPR